MKYFLLVILTTIFCTAWAEESVKTIPADRLVERQGITYEVNSLVPFTGVSEVYYKNGQLQERGAYVSGVLDGLIKSVKTIPGGRLVERQGIIYEVNSQVPFSGVFEVYHWNGQVNESANFRSGKLDGSFESYYENGQLKTRGTYVSGLLDGPFEWYDENGRLKRKTTYKLGAFDGPIKSDKAISTDRLVERQGIKYEVNSKVPFSGVTEVYYENGQLQRRETYIAGEYGGLYEWYHENGQLEWRGTMKSGEYDGLREKYNENGQLKARITMKSGELDGLQEKYHENGQLDTRTTYKSGEKDGPVERYFENGQLRARGTHRSGELKLTEAYDENGRMTH